MKLIPKQKLQFLSHSNQIGQGFRLHLMHDVSALNFDGNLASSEFRCHLLVQHSGND